MGFEQEATPGRVVPPEAQASVDDARLPDHAVRRPARGTVEEGRPFSFTLWVPGFEWEKLLSVMYENPCPDMIPRRWS